MKILLLGGGTGGHFYPLIAVARALKTLKLEKHLVKMRIVFMSNVMIDRAVLIDEDIAFERTLAGKWRRYVAFKNVTDVFRTLGGIFQAIWKFMLDPPDIIFSEGGYAAFPALVAARFYRIPIIVHEPNSVPGAVNAWTGKFARRIGITFPEAAKHFPKEKTAIVGYPIRKNILGGTKREALEIFTLEEGIPTILVLGGSQGAEAINNTVISALPKLVSSFQIIHQTGKENFKSVKGEAVVSLERASASLRGRYHPYPYLNEPELRSAGRIGDIIVARAGAGTIAEAAAWGVPLILIPLPKAAGDHQRENAYNYARIGAAEVVEQENLTPNLLESRISSLLDDAKKMEIMGKAARNFSRPDAARRIAEEIVELGTHE